MPAEFTTTALGEAPTGTVANTELSDLLVHRHRAGSLIGHIDLVAGNRHPRRRTTRTHRPIDDQPGRAHRTQAANGVASAPTSSPVSAEVRSRLPSVNDEPPVPNSLRAAAANAHISGDATGTSPVPEPNNGATAAETACTTLCDSGSAVWAATGALTVAVDVEEGVSTCAATGSMTVVTVVAACGSATEAWGAVVDCAETTGDADRAGAAAAPAVFTLS